MQTSDAVKPTREELVAALDGSANIQAVADRFGVSRMTVYRWRRDYGIEVKRVAKAA